MLFGPPSPPWTFNDQSNTAEKPCLLEARLFPPHAPLMKGPEGFTKRETNVCVLTCWKKGRPQECSAWGGLALASHQSAGAELRAAGRQVPLPSGPSAPTDGGGGARQERGERGREGGRS